MKFMSLHKLMLPWCSDLHWKQIHLEFSNLGNKNIIAFALYNIGPVYSNANGSIINPINFLSSSLECIMSMLQEKLLLEFIPKRKLFNYPFPDLISINHGCTLCMLKPWLLPDEDWRENLEILIQIWGISVQIVWAMLLLLKALNLLVIGN